MGALVCMREHVCGFVLVANINIKPYVIFQLSKLVAFNIHRGECLCRRDGREAGSEKANRVSYQIRWKRLSVLGYWFSSQPQRGATQC